VLMGAVVADVHSETGKDFGGGGRGGESEREWRRKGVRGRRGVTTPRAGGRWRHRVRQSQIEDPTFQSAADPLDSGYTQFGLTCQPKTSPLRDENAPAGV